jgi:hypothetical protein
MQETNRTDLAKPTDKKMLDIADALQKQLLQYRLENYHSLACQKLAGTNACTRAPATCIRR